jgi:hypothetical protein
MISWGSVILACEAPSKGLIKQMADGGGWALPPVFAGGKSSSKIGSYLGWS